MNRYVWLFVDNGSDSHEPLVFGSKKRAMSIYQKKINDIKDEAVEIVKDSSEYGSAATVIFDDGMEYSFSVSKIYIQ